MARTYPAIGGSLRSLPFDAATDPRKGLYMVDDFVNGGLTTGIIGALGWTLTGTGGTATYVAAEADAPGILKLTGATTGFAAGLSLAAFPFKASATGQLYMACRFRIPTALTNREVRIGFTDAAPTAARPANGVYLEYDAAVDSDDWLVTGTVASAATARTAANAIAAPAFGTMYVAEILVTTVDAKVYLDGELVADDPLTAIPTSALSPFVYVGDGTNGATLDVDYVVVKGVHARAGFAAV